MARQRAAGLQPFCDHAVSPVIGVILMTAITVVLAAVVWVMMDSLSDPESTKSIPAFSEKAGVLTVEKAEKGLDWFDDLRVSGSCTPLLNGNAWPTPSGSPITAGDRICGCGAGEDLVLAFKGTNTLVYSGTF